MSDPARNVLCYGDSLTYGARPDSEARHVPGDRWPLAMAQCLGPEVEVIAEGLNGRTTAWDTHDGAAERNGARILPTLLHSHAPLDLVVILLGTNDVFLVEASARRAAAGLRRLAEIVRSHPCPGGGAVPDLVLVSPPWPVKDPAGLVTDDDIARARGLAPAYRGLADEIGAGFFDAAGAVESSPRDGVHLEADQSRALGRALAGVVRARLGR